MEEEGKVDSMFMENLEEWILEEDKVVTYKYLSKALKCHVNVAKQMLFNFVQEQRNKDNTNLGIVYLVSGFVKSDEGADKLKVAMINEKDLDKQTKKFQKVLTKHIYSVQNHKNISSTTIYATDIMSVREDIYSSNAQNAIKNKAAVPRPTETFNQKPSTSSATTKAVKPEVKKEPSASVTAKVKQEEKKPMFSASTTAKKEESGKKPANSAGKKGGSNIASMFAKQAATAKTKPKEEPATPGAAKEELGSSTSPGKENMENARIEKEKEKSNEKKPEAKVSASKKSAASASKLAKNKKNSSSKDANKKRKRIMVQSDSDESDEEREEVEDRGAQSEDEAPPQARIIESDEEEEIPSTPQLQSKTNSQTGGRRKVRKEVDKTYIDDKGFMVTKKEFVYESEEDDGTQDSPPAPVQKAKPAVMAENKKSPPAAEKPAAKKAKLAAGVNAKQPGIMSFFKKK
eukprot:TRINITY_DN2751_c0_g1_i4.p1 TRINITY_DN2751_c0_g1~~TRINITY_DN2751_c0_g1_i4.p1  ORF type:complete len:460 (+),score=194.14 TRINITY_DN2751_c0_g1_i4:41-1420(+)